MDPLAILGGVGAAAGIIVTITKTVKHLSDLQEKYADSENSIRQLIRQLLSMKASLNQIREWTELNLSRTPKERELVEAFDISFEGCKEAMDTIADEVARLVQDGLAGERRTMRLRYLWNEESMKDHQARLDRQVQALQLLLSAVQCRTASEQTALLREPRSRQIVEKIRDDTSSLRAASTRGSIVRTSSVVSHGNYTVGSTEFEMDNTIVNTDVYRRAMNHHRTRSADERQRGPQGGNSPSTPEGTSRLSPNSGSTEWTESSDYLSPIDARFNRNLERPRPYERSVASDPVSVPRQFRRPQVNITSASDTFLPGLNMTGKAKLQKKRSFLPSLFTGSSSTLATLSPKDSRASNHRRGRRHSDTDIHRSIDLHSSDGRSAPPLVQAAQSGSGIEIEELLDQGVDIEGRHERTKRTALHIACHCGNDDVAAILLHRGANPKVIDAQGMTPLHLAATRGHYRVVEYLLKEDVDVDAPGPEKKTALRLAADNGHVEVVDLLLSQRAKVNSRDAQNITALHSASRIGDEDIVNILLNYKADIEAKDGEFQAAIHHAAEKGHDRIVEILLSKKANIEALGKEKHSPLTVACASGATDVLRLLLQRKASLKHKCEGAMTALHWASFNGHEDVVDVLIEKRVPIDPRTNDGRTPLHLAVMSNNFAVAELLLRKGASVDAYCHNLLRPLHYAAPCDIGVIQLLLGHGATMEAETNAGKRPLHYATSQGNIAMLELLLEKGALIDARDGAGDRPLSLASAEGNIEAVRTLLNRGAAMRTRYAKGPSHEDSPLCIAAKNGHLPVVQEFVQRGASVRQRDESNWQPLRYAAYYGHPDIVQYLLTCGASITSLDTPGSFGFNLTASRIGFAPHADIDEFRRQSVLMLLHDAEVREQESQNDTRSHPPIHSPRQDFPAEKADDNDDGSSQSYQPVAERQELPGGQTSPNKDLPPYQNPIPTNEPNAGGRNTEPSSDLSEPARPRSPPAVSQASRFTLDPNSSFRPTWNPVSPPEPSSNPIVNSTPGWNPVSPPESSSHPISSFNPSWNLSPPESSANDSYAQMSPPDPTVSPLPPYSLSDGPSSPRIVSPFPNYNAGTTSETSKAPQPSPHIPQSPTRPPPPPPVASAPPVPSVPTLSPTEASDSSPTMPTRPPPVPPTLPPVPNPNDAIVVCDSCGGAGVTTTDLSCTGCREALFMYHHVMFGEALPNIAEMTISQNNQLPSAPHQLYELA